MGLFDTAHRAHADLIDAPGETAWRVFTMRAIETLFALLLRVAIIWILSR